MDQYIVTRLVSAEPMQREGVDGYVVKYDGGFESWWPKAVFESGFTELVPNQNMKTDKPSVSKQMVDDFIVDLDVFTKKGKITIVIATLKNGFTVVESSACVSPDNYSEEIGADICMERIRNKVWTLLGFLLQEAIGK